MRVRASVIVPTHNKASRLRLTLTSFAYQTTTDFEVIVCDDGSTDETSTILGGISPPYPLRIVRGRHAGAAAARNRAAAVARGSVLVFSDDDMVPAPGYIEAHARACVSDRVLSRGLRWSVPIHEVDRFLDRDPSPEVYREIWKTARFTVAENWVAKALERPERHPYRFLQSCTSNLAIAARTFQDLGGFDESFGAGWGAEDTEFGYRAQDADVEIVLTEDALNLHLEHSTDSGAKFERGLENFRRFRAMYADRREVRTFLSYLEHAIQMGGARDLFDEQSFVDRERPVIDQRKTVMK